MLRRIIFRTFMQIPGARYLWSKVPFGPLELRVRYGAAPRPHYSYGVYRAAEEAKHLGLSAIRVIECGVAGGNGLVALESAASEISQNPGIEIAVFGFDSGMGMPEPVDYRDVPHLWGAGLYRMDEPALRARLKNAELIIGDVAQTIPAFLARRSPPVGFIAFDLDYYSSTKSAFRIFDGAEDTRLPRVYCYFDDVADEYGCNNEFVGELCAIREFNCEHDSKKICLIHLLGKLVPLPQRWHEQTYVMHDFKHSLYCRNVVSEKNRLSQFPLTKR